MVRVAGDTFENCVYQYHLDHFKINITNRYKTIVESQIKNQTNSGIVYHHLIQLMCMRPVQLNFIQLADWMCVQSTFHREYKGDNQLD